MRLILFLFLFAAIQAVGQTVPVRVAGGSFAPVGMAAHATIFEEKEARSSIENVHQLDSLFKPLNSYRQKKPGNIFWLKINLANTGNQPSPAVLSFINITYVDAWLYSGDSMVFGKKAGVFQLGKNIADGDERSFVNLEMAPKSSYILYLRAAEVKGFMPSLNFKLAGRDYFYKKLYQRRGIDVALMGGIALLFIYILISWLLSGFRPYIWLMLFSFGIFMYTFCLKGYLIDWVLPNHPIFAWTLTSHFAHLGLAGSCFLIDDFLGLRGMKFKYYQLFKTFPVILAVASVSMFGMVYLFKDYPYSLYTSTVVTAFIYPLATYFTIKVWGHLPKEKKVFAVGVLMAIALGVSQNLLFFVMAEAAIAPAALIASSGLLCIMLLFLVSIKEGLRSRQKDKYKTLAELSFAQEQQNIELEEKVRERTTELDLRNQKIQSLMHELQHRVKNNLQLLYGLNRMKEPQPDDKAEEVWKKNLVQIKAISLANNQLEGNGERGSIWLHEYMQQVVTHTRHIYDAQQQIPLTLRLQEGVRVKVSNAISVGLILTELLANSYQHAFIDMIDDEAIVIKFFKREGKSQLLYYDSGEGVEELFFQQKQNGGFALIKDLARQSGVAINLQYKAKEVLDMGRNGTPAKEEMPSMLFSFTFPATL